MAWQLSDQEQQYIRRAIIQSPEEIDETDVYKIIDVLHQHEGPLRMSHVVEAVEYGNLYRLEDAADWKSESPSPRARELLTWIENKYDRRMTIQLVHDTDGAHVTFHAPDGQERDYYPTPSSIKRLARVIRHRPKWKIVPCNRSIVGYFVYCIQRYDE